MNKRFFSFVFALNLLMVGTSVQIFAENLFHPTDNHANEPHFIFSTNSTTEYVYAATPMPIAAPAPLPADACSATCGTTVNGKIIYCTGNDECAASGCYDWLYPGKI
jgi:hypothetical protein